MFDDIIKPVLRYGYKYGLFIGFVSIYWISGILSYSELERYPISINVNVCIVSLYAFSRELSFHQNSNTVWTSTIVPGLISWNKKWWLRKNLVCDNRNNLWMCSKERCFVFFMTYSYKAELMIYIIHQLITEYLKARIVLSSICLHYFVTNILKSFS